MSAYNNNRPCINTKNSKVSHLLLYAESATPFKATTEVKANSVKDTGKGYAWSGKVVGRTGGVVIGIRLKCTQGNRATTGHTSRTGLDSGQISITLTDTATGQDGPPVIPVEVDYVMDNET